jgi:outer membrane lipoprotein-sorting protein
MLKIFYQIKIILLVIFFTGCAQKNTNKIIVNTTSINLPNEIQDYIRQYRSSILADEKYKTVALYKFPNEIYYIYGVYYLSFIYTKPCNSFTYIDNQLVLIYDYTKERFVEITFSPAQVTEFSQHIEDNLCLDYSIAEKDDISIGQLKGDTIWHLGSYLLRHYPVYKIYRENGKFKKMESEEYFAELKLAEKRPFKRIDLSKYYRPRNRVK